MRAKFVNEDQNFERGLDPKQAMGIGTWIKGYRVDSPGEYSHIDGYNRISFDPYYWNFTRKACNLDEVSKTKVLPHMEKALVLLPVVTFKYYYKIGNMTGLFGDWPEDFPFTKTPFIANVLEDEGRSFLIEPEGYNYPRYITELI